MKIKNDCRRDKLGVTSTRAISCTTQDLPVHPHKTSYTNGWIGGLVLLVVCQSTFFRNHFCDIFHICKYDGALVEVIILY